MEQPVDVAGGPSQFVQFVTCTLPLSLWAGGTTGCRLLRSPDQPLDWLVLAEVKQELRGPFGANLVFAHRT
jgi:hypothetical protein